MSACGTKQMPSLPCCNWSVPSVDGRLQSAEQFPSLYGQVGQLALLPRSLPGLVLPHLEPELLQTWRGLIWRGDATRIRRGERLASVLVARS